MSANPSLLIWCDLETTGLDPYETYILETAIGIAPFSNPFLLGPIYERVLYANRGPDSHGNKFILDMHTKNGLWDECERSHLTTKVVDIQIASMIRNALAESGSTEKPVLAGSTVHFDLGYIRRWLPETAALLSHRVYDVSGIKLFCQSLGMEPLVSEAEAAHRAKDDILASIDHAKRCIAWLAEKGFNQDCHCR